MYEKTFDGEKCLCMDFKTIGSAYDYMNRNGGMYVKRRRNIFSRYFTLIIKCM